MATKVGTAFSRVQDTSSVAHTILVVEAGNEDILGILTKYMHPGSVLVMPEADSTGMASTRQWKLGHKADGFCRLERTA